MTKLVRFCAMHLFPELCNDDYKVLVKFLYTLERGVDGETAYYGDRISPRKCIIKIDAKLKLSRMTRVLIHEMVHVKQFFKEELVNLGANSNFEYMWKHGLYDITDENYWMLPWEIEAYGYELCIYNTFIQTYDLPKLLLNLDYSSILDRM
ncbi:MAG: hypothetical protein NTZ20_04745 [Candidatus Levybacteria bacterium]|nr:hypothetical protein [Candidatus Levybacteria bacterium]